MMLSLVTMICDGTEKLLLPWIENAKRCIKIPHELIVVDNTTEQTVPEWDEIKVVRAGHNSYPFAGRRLGVESASGEYVFLTDCDDSVLPLKNFEWDEELICFNYMAKLENDDKEYVCSEPYRLSYTASKGIFFDQSWKTVVKNMVWNKFYKKDLLMRVYSKLPYFEICFLDDTLLNMLVLAEVKSIRFETKAYYMYNFGTGMSTKRRYKSIEPLERVFSGMETALSVFNLAFTKEVQQQSGISTLGLYKSAMVYALQKYSNIDDSILEEYSKLIGKYFEKDSLLLVLKGMTDKDIDRKTMLKAKHCINDYL